MAVPSNNKTNECRKHVLGQENKRWRRNATTELHPTAALPKAQVKKTKFPA
jgi:hypothetical protein